MGAKVYTREQETSIILYDHIFDSFYSACAYINRTVEKYDLAIFLIVSVIAFFSYAVLRLSFLAAVSSICFLVLAFIIRKKAEEEAEYIERLSSVMAMVSRVAVDNKAIRLFHKDEYLSCITYTNIKTAEYIIRDDELWLYTRRKTGIGRYSTNVFVIKGFGLECISGIESKGKIFGVTMKEVGSSPNFVSHKGRERTQT